MTVAHGAVQSFSITPEAGYQIQDVTVDGSSVGAVSTYTFSDVTTDHQIVASFAVRHFLTEERFHRSAFIEVDIVRKAGPVVIYEQNLHGNLPFVFKCDNAKSVKTDIEIIFSDLRVK